MHVLSIVPTGPKQALPGDLINITDFEWSMSQGYEKNNNRGSFPTSSWPNPKERVQSNFPELVWGDYLPNMATFALGAYKRSVSDYLDAKTLKNSYQAAYRLLLARKLADILSTDLNQTETVLATRRYQTETLIMIPTFVYIVEGLLATTTLIALTIFCMPSWRKTNLGSEPASIASLMTLVCKDHPFVENMSANDSTTSQQLEELFQSATFTLQRGLNHQEPTLRYLGPDVQSPSKKDLLAKPTSPILPPELSWRFGLGLITLQGLVVAGLAYTYIRAHLHNGKKSGTSHRLLADFARFATPVKFALHQPNCGQVSADDSGCLLRTDLHMAYEDALHASTLRAASQRQCSTITLTSCDLQFLASTSCDAQSSQDKVHLLSLFMLHHDISGERCFCSVKRYAIRTYHSASAIAEFHSGLPAPDQCFWNFVYSNEYDLRPLLCCNNKPYCRYTSASVD